MPGSPEAWLVGLPATAHLGAKHLFPPRTSQDGDPPRTISLTHTHTRTHTHTPHPLAGLSLSQRKSQGQGGVCQGRPPSLLHIQKAARKVSIQTSPPPPHANNQVRSIKTRPQCSYLYTSSVDRQRCGTGGRSVHTALCTSPVPQKQRMQRGKPGRQALIPRPHKSDQVTHTSPVHRPQEKGPPSLVARDPLPREQSSAPSPDATHTAWGRLRSQRSLVATCRRGGSWPGRIPPAQPPPPRVQGRKGSHPPLPKSPRASLGTEAGRRWVWAPQARGKGC